jgi:hypothetical protein
MARNRKNQSAALRFGPALKALVICLLIAGSGVGYVWQKNQIIELGNELTRKERRYRSLVDQNEKYRQQLAALRAPGALTQRVKELELGLVPSEPSQVVRLAEPTRLSVGGAGRDYAAHWSQPPVPAH